MLCKSSGAYTALNIATKNNAQEMVGLSFVVSVIEI